MKTFTDSSYLFASTIAFFAVAPWRASGAEEFTTHTYQLVTATLTWHQAKTDAESRGGHLATITSQAEFDHLRSLGVLPTGDSYWLGATDEGHEGIWTWVTGEPWSFNLWSGGEPNNQGLENYLVAGSSIDHHWNDWGREDSTQTAYLLEIDGFCSPHKARATAEVVNGFVVGANVTDVGCGYTNAPVVLIQGGGGTGATATASILDGRVTRINIVSAGCCYTNLPRIVIASPPFVPTVSISVSKVKVTQNVVLGRKYQLDASNDLTTWAATGPAFIAESEIIEDEFDVDATGRYFRIREVP